MRVEECSLNGDMDVVGNYKELFFSGIFVVVDIVVFSPDQ